MHIIKKKKNTRCKNMYICETRRVKEEEDNRFFNDIV